MEVRQKGRRNKQKLKYTCFLWEPFSVEQFGDQILVFRVNDVLAEESLPESYFPHQVHFDKVAYLIDSGHEDCEIRTELDNQ